MKSRQRGSSTIEVVLLAGVFGLSAAISLGLAAHRTQLEYRHDRDLLTRPSP